jgi:hypothetical protein
MYMYTLGVGKVSFGVQADDNCTFDL